MRVNSEEALRRGRAARDKAGSRLELRKTNALRSFATRDSKSDPPTVKTGQDRK